LWYVVRRHLGFSIDEWELLPWWQQMVYAEGLREEFYDEDASIQTDDSDDWSNLPAGVEVTTVIADV